MSTSTDAPPAASGPPDGPEEPADGANWLQQEMARRMAARASSGGGRHARRDGGEPPRGVDHVPRHSVATPGPGSHRPSPVGGPALPASLVPAPAPAWSGPAPTDPDGLRETRSGTDVPTPAEVPTPPAAPARADVTVQRALARPVASGPPPSAAAGSAAAALPGAVRSAVPPPPAVRPAAAPPAPDEVLGGPSRSARPVPRAFRRSARGLPTDTPAVFGGPGFSEPAARRQHAPHEPDSFGGPGFELPAARTDHAPADPARTAADRAAEHRVDADGLGLDLPEQTPRAPVTIATGPAADVVPPRAPARLLAAPPAEPEVETTTRLDLVPDEDDDDLHDLADGDDGEVLWSREVPLDDPDGMVADSGNRVLVVLSERRSRARAVRTVESIQEGGAVGELLRGDLIRSQLRVALRFALVAGLLLGLLPLAFALFPAIGQAELFGFRLPWIVLGVAVYPFLYGLGWLHTRTAERVEHEFAERVQD